MKHKQIFEAPEICCVCILFFFFENAAMYRGEPMNVPTEEEADQKRKSQ